MTICIAATLVSKPSASAIVTISDMMLSDDVSSADVTTLKLRQIKKAGSWWCMYSGIPSEFEELIRHAEDQLSPSRQINASVVMLAVEKGYAETIKHRVETQVLMGLGLTQEQLIDAGVETFGPEYFNQLSEECRAIRLETDLLVVGYDSDGAHIFSVDHKTSSCVSYDQLGFQAVGTGAWAALGSLFGHPYFRQKTLNEVVYRMCEAKLVSETARSVGAIGIVEVFYPDGSSASFPMGGDQDAIKKAWEAQRDMPIPAGLLGTIDTYLKAGHIMPLHGMPGPPRTKDPAS